MVASLGSFHRKTEDIEIVDGGTGASDAPTAVTNLGALDVPTHNALPHAGLPGIGSQTLMAQFVGNSTISMSPNFVPAFAILIGTNPGGPVQQDDAYVGLCKGTGPGDQGCTFVDSGNHQSATINGAVALINGTDAVWTCSSFAQGANGVVFTKSGAHAGNIALQILLVG
jgi:hypothetical protein